MRNISFIFLFLLAFNLFPQSSIVNDLKVVLDKEKSGALISWKPPSETKRVVIARSTSVIDTVEKALNADSLGKYYTGSLESNDIVVNSFRDLNLTPGQYYYAVLNVDEVYRRKVTLVPGKNYTTKPITISENRSSSNNKKQNNTRQPYPLYPPIIGAPMAYYDNRDYYDKRDNYNNNNNNDNDNRDKNNQSGYRGFLAPYPYPYIATKPSGRKNYPKNKYKYAEMHVKNISYTFSSSSGEVLLRWDPPENADKSVSYTIYQSNGPLSGGINSFFRNGVSKIVTVNYPYKYVMLTPKKVGSFYFAVTVKRNGHENFDLLEKESYILVDAIRDSEKEVRSLSFKLDYTKNRIHLEWLPPENPDETVSYGVYESRKPLDEGKSSFNKRVLSVGYVKHPNRKISVDLPQKGGKYYYGVTVLRSDREYYELHINRSYIEVNIDPKKLNYLSNGASTNREIITERNILNERNVVTEQQNNVVTEQQNNVVSEQQRSSVVTQSTNTMNEIRSLMEERKNLTFEQAREIVQRRREVEDRFREEESKLRLYAGELVPLQKNLRSKVRELVDLSFVPKLDLSKNELIDKNTRRNRRRGSLNELLEPDLQRQIYEKIPVLDLLRAQQALSYLSEEELLRAEEEFRGRPANELLRVQPLFRRLPEEELIRLDRIFSILPAEELLKAQRNVISKVPTEELLRVQKIRIPKKAPTELLVAQKIFLSKIPQELFGEEFNSILGLPTEELFKARKVLSALSAKELIRAEKKFKGKPASELLKAQASIKKLSPKELLQIDKTFSKVSAEELLKAQKILSGIKSKELIRAEKKFKGKPAIELFIAQKRSYPRQVDELLSPYQSQLKRGRTPELMYPQNGKYYSNESELIRKKKYSKDGPKANSPELVKRRQYRFNKNRDGDSASLISRDYGDMPDPNAYKMKRRDEDEKYQKYAPKVFYREKKEVKPSYKEPPKEKRKFKKETPRRKKDINSEIDRIIRELFFTKKV